MKSHAPIVLFATAAALLVAGCQAISLDDLVKAKVPLQVQKSDGLPSKLPLSDSRDEYDRWRSEVQATDAQWRESIGNAGEFAGILSGLAMTSLEAYSPLAGPAAAPLMILGGYFFGKRRESKEKRDSYNRGIEIGKSLVTLPNGTNN